MKYFILLLFVLLPVNLGKKTFTESTNSKIEYYIINLERSSDRWKKISNDLDSISLKYKRFNAIDGYKIKIKKYSNHESFSGIDIKNQINKLERNNYYEIYCNPNDNHPSFEFYQDRERTYTSGELGIWCSNYKAWQQSQQSDNDYIVILEDDVIIKDSNFEKSINILLEYLPADADVLFLDNIQYAGVKMLINPYITSYLFSPGTWGNWAVLYTKQGMEKLLKYNCYSYAVDNFIWSLDGSKTYPRPQCISPDTPGLNLYGTTLKLLDVEKTNSEICKMGRDYWHC